LTVTAAFSLKCGAKLEHFFLLCKFFRLFFQKKSLRLLFVVFQPCIIRVVECVSKRYEVRPRAAPHSYTQSLMSKFFKCFNNFEWIWSENHVFIQFCWRFSHWIF